MLVSRQYQLNRLKTIDLLNGLSEVGNQAISIYLLPGLSEPAIRELVDNALSSQNNTAKIAELVTSSTTGATVFWGSSRKLLIQPPFPLAERFISLDTDVEPLRSMLDSTPTVALILVRLGAFAVGVYQGEKLVASKVGTGFIHGRHRKGGSSQRRFERRRNDQTRNFLERVCSHARQQLEPHSSEISYLAYGGARTTIHSLKKQCPFLKQYEERTLPPLLNIPRPRQAVLEAAITDVWSSTITEWYEDESSGTE